MLCTVFGIGRLANPICQDTCQECKENLNEAQVNSVEFALQMNYQVLIIVQAGAMFWKKLCEVKNIYLKHNLNTVSRFNLVILLIKNNNRGNSSSLLADRSEVENFRDLLSDVARENFGNKDHHVQIKTFTEQL